MRIYSLLKQFLGLFGNKKEPFVYVALGDSTVEGLGASTKDRAFAHIISSFLKKYKGNVQFFNLGKSGATSHDVLEHQVDRAIQLKPDLITLSVGSNDIVQKRSLKDFKKDMYAILGKLTKTHAEIVINNIPDISVTPAVPTYLKVISNFMVQKLNTIIEKAANEHQVILVDLYFQSSIYGKAYPESISSDNFHPSDFGYAIWANTIISHIRHIIHGHKKPLVAY